MNELNIVKLETYKDKLEKKIKEITRLEKPLIDDDIKNTIFELLSDSKFYTKEGLKQLNRYNSSLDDNSADDLLTDSSFVEILGYHALRLLFKKEDGYKIIFKIGSTIFPDITIMKDDFVVGFEIKRMTDEDVLGNSVTQTLKLKFNEIFSICFYNDGKEPHISKYEEIIDSIKVDHNPRFSLKLKNDGDNDVLPCSLVEYFNLEQKKKEELVAKYIAENCKTDEYRWYHGYGKKTLVEFIKEISNIPEEGKLDEIRADVFAKFPDKIFTSRDYHWMRNYILEEELIVGASKDWFTANSKKDDPIIYKHFERLLDKVNERINVSEKENWKITVKEKLKSKIDESQSIWNPLTTARYEVLLEAIDKKII